MIVPGISREGGKERTRWQEGREEKGWGGGKVTGVGEGERKVKDNRKRRLQFVSALA